jgi:predicted XRE-type DNA-binding protein
MIKVERGSTNVYRDLGYADADEMLVKAQLASKIAEIIKGRGLTQAQAAEVLGMPRPKCRTCSMAGFAASVKRRCLAAWCGLAAMYGLW